MWKFKFGAAGRTIAAYSQRNASVHNGPETLIKGKHWGGLGPRLYHNLARILARQQLYRLALSDQPDLFGATRGLDGMLDKVSYMLGFGLFC